MTAGSQQRDLQLQLQESAERIRAILDASQDAFIGFDFKGIITGWNASAERMFGWSVQEAVGQPLADLIVPERLRCQVDTALAQFTATGTGDFTNRMLELIVADRTGKEFTVETSISLGVTCANGFFSAFLHDITERREIEVMKADFVSGVSHELRTPLTAIRLSLGMLSDGSMGVLDPGVQKLLDIAHNSCERLVSLINDILDSEKIAAGQIEFNFVSQSMMPIIESAIEASRAFSLQYGVVARVESDGSDPHALVDRDRMVQVLVNLLSNSAKFSPEGGEVLVRLETREASLRIAVVDRGTGIPVAFRDRIFEKFTQADASNTRTRNGTGLGLSICRALVQAHHGEIGFVSASGEGSTFYVDLPLA